MNETHSLLYIHWICEHVRGNINGIWTDIKVVNDVAYIGSEVVNHGVQIFDLKRLDSLDIPEKGLERGDVPRLELDGYVDTIGSSHNIIAFPENKQILVVGYGGSKNDTTACNYEKGETVVVLDVSKEPFNPPTSCLNIGGEINMGPQPPYSLVWAHPGYVHDAQCEHKDLEVFCALPLLCSKKDRCFSLLHIQASSTKVLTRIIRMFQCASFLQRLKLVSRLLSMMLFCLK